MRYQVRTVCSDAPEKVWGPLETKDAAKDMARQVRKLPLVVNAYVEEYQEKK